MSYRECRTLCEMLRSLNYNRIISLENFAKPNFELVADILYWLSQKYDPQSDISDDINEEKDRVEFMKSIVNLFTVKARIKLNPKKLYQADGEAVSEILKIASVLYKVHVSIMQASNSKAVEEEEAAAFALPAKVSNLKAHKALSNEICDLGARLYDAMSREPELKKVRNQALAFLEGMSGVNDGNDQAYIEQCIKTIMQQQDENTRQMTKYVSNMEHQQRLLEEKLKKKAAQLERNQKRYRNLVTVKPAFMQEYERLEQELARLQEIYVNKYRNLDYLENELQVYNKIEEEKLKKAKKQLQKMQKKVREQEIKDLGNVDQLDEGLLGPEDERTFTRGNSRKAEQNEPQDKKGNQQHQQSDDQDGDGNEDDQDEQSGEEIEDEDDDSDF